MASGEGQRVVAWAQELRRTHDRLREALAAARGAQEGEAGSQDLLLFCRGFCTALARHHQGEDRTLFPALAAARPDLADTLRTLEQDHGLIAQLLGDLERAIGRRGEPAELERHLDGLAAIMESHFRFEERALASVLDGLRLPVDLGDALGTPGEATS